MQWLQYCWLSSWKLMQESGLVKISTRMTARPQAAGRRGARAAGKLQALFLLNAFFRCKCLSVEAFDAQAWCEGGWVAGRLAGTPEAPLVEVDEAPAGEGGTLEVRQFATQLQEADASVEPKNTQLRLDALQMNCLTRSPACSEGAYRHRHQTAFPTSPPSPAACSCLDVIYSHTLNVTIITSAGAGPSGNQEGAPGGELGARHGCAPGGRPHAAAGPLPVRSYLHLSFLQYDATMCHFTRLACKQAWLLVM